MKRTSVIAIIFLLAAGSAGSLLAWFSTAMASSRLSFESGTVLGAQNIAAEGGMLESIRPYPRIKAGAPAAFANSRRFALYHVESDSFVASSNAEQAVPVASTTKLMTARIVLAHANLADQVKVERVMLSTGSTMALRTNEVMSVENLLYGLMLVSGNDAANALAAHTGRLMLKNPAAPFDQALNRFIQAMNDEATRLGLSETSFQDPAGLMDEGVSSARDLGKLMAINLNNPTFVSIAATPERTVYDVSGNISHQLKHSNRLLNDYGYLGAGASKTGFTFAAGHCLVATAERNGMTLIAVILSTYSETKEASALEARRLLDWGFANLEVTIPSSGF